MKQFSEFNRDDNSLKYVRQIFNTFKIIYIKKFKFSALNL